jgi:outer membrane cobalamin receptor
LPYTPTEKVIFNVGVHYRNFKAQLNYNYVGYRYTTTDNTQFLAPFATLGLDLSKSITVKNCQVTAFFQANNLSNVAYQMIAYFATPGRSFQFGLSINFNKPNPKP